MGVGWQRAFPEMTPVLGKIVRVVVGMYSLIRTDGKATCCQYFLNLAESLTTCTEFIQDIQPLIGGRVACSER